jgi:antitoxin (DNA-binding transcriptional repressor) of toxin-antitoxin stability system
MAVSATQLRQNIYSILDEALKTGKSVEIERKGKTLRIVPQVLPAKEMVDESDLSEFPKFARMTKKNWLIGDEEDITKLELHQWSELKHWPKKRARK